MNNRKGKGISSVEIIIVMIIIFSLMAMIMIATLNVVNASNDAERKANINQFMKILMAVRIRDGAYPVENIECNIGKDCQTLDQVFYQNKLDDIPKDPRGEENYYKYKSDGKTFSIRCWMADNSEYVYSSDNN